MLVELKLRNGIVYDGQRWRRGEVVAVTWRVARHLVEVGKARLCISEGIDERTFFTTRL